MSEPIRTVTPESLLQDVCSYPDDYIVITGDKRMTVKEFREWLDTKPGRIDGIELWPHTREVDEKMSHLNPYARFYWCEADACGCSGCANFAGVTKVEWQEWVDRNEPPEAELLRQVDTNRPKADVIADVMRLSQGRAIPKRVSDLLDALRSGYIIGTAIRPRTPTPDGMESVEAVLGEDGWYHAEMNWPTQSE